MGYSPLPAASGMIAGLLTLFKKRLSGKPADDPLAQFQNKLVMLLYSTAAPAQIKAQLLADPALVPFHDYIREMEEPMLDIAKELAAKWGKA